MAKDDGNDLPARAAEKTQKIRKVLIIFARRIDRVID